MPDWSLVLLLGVASLYLQFSLLIGYNQYYLLNEQLLLKSEDKINPYLSVHTTSTDNLATSGYDKFGYRCKKSRLEFHNRVSNIYILSAPSLLYLLVVLLLNLIQPTKHYPHSYFLEMLVVAKLVSLLLITPALLYLCARTTSLVSYHPDLEFSTLPTQIFVYPGGLLLKCDSCLLSDNALREQ